MAVKSLVPAFCLAASVAANAIPRSATISFDHDIVAEAGGVHNVQITYNSPLDGELSLHYGSCESQTTDDCHHELGRTYVGTHVLARRHEAHADQRPTKFIWLPPNDITSGGCLHAFSGATLVGRSSPVTVKSRKQKRWLAVCSGPYHRAFFAC